MPDALLAREPEITDALVAAHGLKPDEYQRILDLIGRVPTLTELGIFSAMWNEHCSYKSLEEVAADAADHRAAGDLRAGRERRRRRHRRRAGAGLQDGEPQPPLLHRALPGRGDRGRRHPARRLHHGRAADRGDERAVVRRAVASEDPQPRARRRRGHRRLRQRLRGADGRGRAALPRRPTTATASSTPSRPGLADADAIFYSAASGVGMPVVYLGAKTGRDGVGGATMASAEFDDTIEEKRPTVQVGDPFTEKRLMEACLELMATGRGDLDPGHGRGRPHLLGGRDGRQGQPRDPARPRPGAGARDRG